MRSGSTPSPPATTPASRCAPTAPAGVARGADAAKDQSYVLHMLGQDQLARTLLPLGEHDEGRGARRSPPRSACAPPPSPTARTCASSPRPAAGARSSATASRSRRPGGRRAPAPRSARSTAVELVTIGQRKGLGLAGGAAPRYVGRRRPSPRPRSPSAPGATCWSTEQRGRRAWRGRAGPVAGRGARAVQRPRRPDAAAIDVARRRRRRARPSVRWAEPQRRVAPGQSVVAYEGDEVVGGGLAD